METIAEVLFFRGSTVFAVLDGASVHDLPAKLAHFKPQHQCLYSGKLEQQMAEVAPYLVFLEQSSAFTDWVLKNALGNNGGIYGNSDADIEELGRHLGRLVKVRQQSGKETYFRFYDPRVWRNYLPTCTPDELDTAFGPVGSYFVEGEDGTSTWQFCIDGSELQKRKICLLDHGDGRIDPRHLVMDPVLVGKEQAAEGGMVIRQEQVSVLADKIFAERMCSFLTEFFPESKKIESGVMEEVVTELAARAADYKLLQERDVAPFIVAAWIFGVDFDVNFLAVKHVLEDRETVSLAKAEWLWHFIEEGTGTLENPLL